MNVLFNIDLNQNQLLNALFQNLAVAPNNPGLGQVYYNTASKTVLVWDGTVWIDMGGDIRDVAAASGSAITISIVNGVATIDIAAASGTQKGTMSAADFAKLAASTAANTANALVQRDASGNIVVGGFSATSGTVGAPAQNPTDIVNFQTLQSYLTSGTKFKGVVKATTTANITLSGVQTIDGVSCAAGDKVLVKNQTNGIENGPYVVAAGAWVRDTTLAASALASGSQFIIDQGAVNADSIILCTTNAGSDTTGTHALTFNKLPTSISVDNVTIEFGAGLLQLKDSGITGSKINPSVFGTGLTFSGGVASVTGYTPVASATVTRKVPLTGSIGGGSAVSFTHNLNTKDVQVEIFNATTDEKVYAKVVTTSVNAVSVTANGANISVRVIVEG